MVEILEETLLDCVKMLPFLFAGFIVIEMLAHYAGDRMNRVLGKVGAAGPAVGAGLGCIPQCGFSVVAANLFAVRYITLGTLLAVFVATSDEAVLIMLGEPGGAGKILPLLGVKVLAGMLAGYGADLYLGKKQVRREAAGKEVCITCEPDGCACEEKQHGIVMHALLHTARIFFYLLIFTLLINIVIAWIGLEQLSGYMLSNSILQPFAAALIGLLPNCASSVLLTKLYLSGVLSFASTAAGLCAGAGIGLLVLFKENQNQRENLKITGLLFLIGAGTGVLLSLLGV